MNENTLPGGGQPPTHSPDLRQVRDVLELAKAQLGEHPTGPGHTPGFKDDTVIEAIDAALRALAAADPARRQRKEEDAWKDDVTREEAIEGWEVMSIAHFDSCERYGDLHTKFLGLQQQIRELGHTPFFDADGGAPPRPPQGRQQQQHAALNVHPSFVDCSCGLRVPRSQWEMHRVGIETPAPTPAPTLTAEEQRTFRNALTLLGMHGCECTANELRALRDRLLAAGAQKGNQ